MFSTVLVMSKYEQAFNITYSSSTSYSVIDHVLKTILRGTITQSIKRVEIYNKR